MTRTPANRKLPADDILLAHIAEGLSKSAIARHYAVSPSVVTTLFQKRGWTTPNMTGRAVINQRPLHETAAKIVVDIFGQKISLPRIPTLHGAYAAASPSAAGA